MSTKTMSNDMKILQVSTIIDHHVIYDISNITSNILRCWSRSKIIIITSHFTPINANNIVVQTLLQISILNDLYDVVIKTTWRWDEKRNKNFFMVDLGPKLVSTYFSIHEWWILLACCHRRLCGVKNLLIVHFQLLLGAEALLDWLWRYRKCKLFGLI